MFVAGWYSSLLNSLYQTSTALANNGWAAASQLPNMTENERKSLLLAKLSFHYNRTVHTEFELSNRKVRKSTYKLLNLTYLIRARCPPRVAVCVVLLQFTRQQSAPVAVELQRHCEQRRQGTGGCPAGE